MSNLIDVVNRTRALNIEIKTIRQHPDKTLSHFQRLALLRTELLRLCPPRRYVWLGGRPIIDLLSEVSRLTT
jgi:hypothetical protein